MLSEIPGIGAAALVLLSLIFLWCFIFTASFAAFRIAQRPRVSRQAQRTRASGALRYPVGWNSEHPVATQQPQRGSSPLYGRTQIKPAPGPRDWEQRI